MPTHKNTLELRTKPVGPWPMNTYILVCPETNDSVLVDPGADPEILVSLMGKSNPTAILLTHTHPDHIGALAEMRTRLDVPLMCHKDSQLQDFDLNKDRYLDSGDFIGVGNYRLIVQHTPGHTEEQICFILEDDYRVIVGDTIFEGGPGKTWSSDGFQLTLQTLQNVILTWPDETTCYPGHGHEFRLGDQRQAIMNFLAKDHGEFCGDATWDM